MSDGFPSMTALLGLLAVAGFQNKDKIAEMLGGGHAASGVGSAARPDAAGLGGLLGNIGGALGGAGVGNVLDGGLSGGLGQLVERFRQKRTWRGR